MKKLTTTILLILTLILVGNIGLAEDHAEISWSNPATTYATLSLTEVSSSISKSSSTSVRVSATTSANQTCSSIGGTLLVQQWTGSTWSTVKTIDFYADNASSHSVDRVVTVESNYSYRVKVSHHAITLETSKTATSTTSSVSVP